MLVAWRKPSTTYSLLKSGISSFHAFSVCLLVFLQPLFNLIRLWVVTKLDELINELSPAYILLRFEPLLKGNQHLVDGVAVIGLGDIGRGNRFLNMCDHLIQCLPFW